MVANVQMRFSVTRPAVRDLVMASVVTSVAEYNSMSKVVLPDLGSRMQTTLNSSTSVVRRRQQRK
jgi:hypothetical protein